MTPPRVALWLLTRSLHPDDREAVIGDVLEEFAARVSADPRHARRWIWTQTRQSIWPNLVRRASMRNARSEPAAGGARAMNGFVTDLRFALRQMGRRQPLTTVVALLSLTAGLALNLLLFTIANGVLFRPLPLRDPSRLALLLLQRDSGVNHNFWYATYAGLRDTLPITRSGGRVQRGAGHGVGRWWLGTVRWRSACRATSSRRLASRFARDGA